MNNITWKYVKPLANSESIVEYETLTGCILPDDIREVIKMYNGGRPSLKYYDLPEEKDKEFKIEMTLRMYLHSTRLIRLMGRLFRSRLIRRGTSLS